MKRDNGGPPKEQTYGPGLMLPALMADSPWVRLVLQPLVLASLVGCVALPLAQLIEALMPGAHAVLIVAGCVLAALEACYGYQLIHRRHITGMELWRFRLIEFATYFVLLKLAHLALVGWPAELAGPGPWPTDLLTLLAVLLDNETLLILVLAVFFAFTVNETLTDLDRVGEPPEPDPNYISPLDSLTGRFFTGGVAVLVLSGLARVGLAQVLDTDRPPVTGLVLNVLVYFLLGLLLLGQVRLGLLATRWQTQGVRVTADLPARWVRYSLAFLALAALLAFALPTGYTAGALGVIGNLFLVLFTIFWALLYLLFSLLLLPFAWLLSALGGESLSSRPPPPPPPPPAFNETLTWPPWVDVLRPLVVWGLVLAMIAYVLVSYLRERPELARAVRQLGPLRALQRLWATLWHRASGLAAAGARVSLDWLRDRMKGQARREPFRFFRLGGAEPREQVLYYYLSMLRRASEKGLHRRPPQTPREYRPLLEQHLPEAAEDVARLTEAFVESRYSAHRVEPEQAQRLRAAWARVRQALREYGRRPGGS